VISPQRRRAATVSLGIAFFAGASLALAGPAGASVPTGWPEPPSVETWHALLIFAVVPLSITLILLVLLYGPALARGENVVPGSPSAEDEWIGGPRRASHELAAPDDADSQAGGAGGTW